ncbi:MAG: DUF1566 domain-containing protein, partial [Bacteroidales bacterium]|nr:DUF1566 domain-containing protein [Bacteroidales bacterium]
MKTSVLVFLAIILSVFSFAQTFKIVDTGQQKYFNNSSEISAASDGTDFYGQDANYLGYQPSYTDNGDGTVTDNNTGLM